MNKDQKNYNVKKGYITRKKPIYFEGDVTGSTIWQPDVYDAALELAKKSGADTIIDIGSGNGDKAFPYKGEFKFIFIDFGPNLKLIEKNMGKKGNQYIDQDFEKGFPEFAPELLKKSVVICSDVIEHMVNPEILAKSLVNFAKYSPFVVISTPDRLRTRGVSHFGPPQNQTHVREWSLEELDTYFRSLGMQNHLTGITRSNDYEQVRRTIAIVAGTFLKDVAKLPPIPARIQVVYKDNKEFANDYYYQQGIVVANEAVELEIKLNSDEWPASPNPLITVGAVIQDAKSKGYGIIEAQVIHVDPHPKYSWPEAGIIRQGHGLIGQLGEVRRLRIATSQKVYPMQLTIFKRSKKSRLSRGKDLMYFDFIDTGHLIDDFMLETLAGWSIIKNHND